VAVANGFAAQDLKLIAKMYYKQADDERDHAMRFTNFRIDSGAEPIIPPLDPVVSTFESALQMLQWFVAEQVEEISTANTNLTVIKRSGNNLYMMEAYLAHD
jgi:ferritin